MPKTAVIIPFGLWEFLRIPFGLMNVGQTFQSFMDNILSWWTHPCYIAKHKKNLPRVMERLRQHGLVINEEKCQIFKPQVEFLGHLVD